MAIGIASARFFCSIYVTRGSFVALQSSTRAQQKPGQNPFSHYTHRAYYSGLHSIYNALLCSSGGVRASRVLQRSFFFNLTERITRDARVVQESCSIEALTFGMKCVLSACVGRLVLKGWSEIRRNKKKIFFC